MRLTTIEEVRNLKDSVTEVYVTAMLSDVRLGSVMGGIYLQGKDYKLSSRAVYRMCRVLGVPYSFAMIPSEDLRC